MSIIKWGVRHESGSFEAKGRRTYVREFLAKTDNPLDAELQIWSYRKCPQVGEVHPRDNLCYVQSVKPERTKSRRHWKVVVDYSSDRETDQDQDNPLDIPAKISLQSEFVSYEATRDAKNKPLLNAAGDLIRGIQRDDVRWIINVRRNVPLFPQWALKAPSLLNDSTVTLRGLQFPRKTLRITGMSIGEEILHGKTIYSQAEIQLTYQEGGWIHEELNRGFTELRYDNVGGKKFTFRDRILIGDPQEPPAEPVFLDLTGRRPRDKDDKPKEVLDPQDIVILKFDLYNEFPFSQLPLK